MSGLSSRYGGSGERPRLCCFFDEFSFSDLFFLPPKKEENNPSFSFFMSLPADLRWLSFFRSSSNLRFSRSNTMLSLPLPAPSIDVCSKSNLVLSCFSGGLGIFALGFELGASVRLSLSLSSFPSNQPQLDFFGSSFLSFIFLLSAFLSSVSVGMNDRLPVLVSIPGSGEGCDDM